MESDPVPITSVHCVSVNPYDRVESSTPPLVFGDLLRLVGVWEGPPIVTKVQVPKAISESTGDLQVVVWTPYPESDPDKDKVSVRPLVSLPHLHQDSTGRREVRFFVQTRLGRGCVFSPDQLQQVKPGRNSVPSGPRLDCANKKTSRTVDWVHSRMAVTVDACVNVPLSNTLQDVSET